MPASSGATASQAWAILQRHARDEISSLRLQELCRDNDRVSSLVSVHNTEHRILMVDLSRQRMTLDTLNHLLRLATARELPKYIRQLAWGPNADPDQPIVPTRLRNKQNSEGRSNVKQQHSTEGAGTMDQRKLGLPSHHLTLRAPRGNEMLLADGSNALTKIHQEWDRLERISDLMRRGQLPGVTGKMIRDVVVVGRGTAFMALRFVYLALCRDEAATIARRAGMKSNTSQRRIKFLSSVDPIRAAAVVADLDPACTLVVSLVLTGTEETTLATETLKSWLLAHLGNGRRTELVMSKHMYLVTGSMAVARSHKKETIFFIPEHSRCEAFTSCTAATLLPLSIVFGWSLVQDFITGAHDMDTHFVETNPRHNLPVLLALTDIWNDKCLASSGRISTPWTEAFAAFPAFCATLESQACGKPSSNRTDTAGLPLHPRNAVASSSSLVIDGGLHGAYDQSLYQTGQIMPLEIAMTLDSQVVANASGTLGQKRDNMKEVYRSQDATICSLFAHADELAFGQEGMSTPTRSYLDSNTGHGSTFVGTGPSDGNRPTSLLLVGRLDAYTCGQLIVLTEHRALVKACILDIDPFAREVGSSTRAQRTEALRGGLTEMMRKSSIDEGDEEDDDPSEVMNISTKTILRHYASLMKSQRVDFEQ